MFFRLPILLARRVAVPAAAPRLLLARPFSYTPLALSPAQAKTRGRPKTASKTKASITKTKAKAKPRPKVRATTSGRKEVVKKVQQPAFSRAQLKVPARRPASGYIIFVSEQMKKGPKVKTRPETIERTKNIAAQWMALSEDQKQIYNDRSAELAKKVKADFSAWLTGVDPVLLREINKKRKARGKPKIRAPPTGPKRPVPPFLQFLSEYRVDNPSVTGPELGKQGGSAWRQLPQTKKDAYLLAYQNAKKAQEARA